MWSFPCYAPLNSSGDDEFGFSLDEMLEDILFNDPPQVDGADVDKNIFESSDITAEVREAKSSTTEKKRNHAAMSDSQKTHRREKNREHAKKSRLRRKFMMESLQEAVKILKTENAKLKDALSEYFPANVLEVKSKDISLLAGNGVEGNCSLDNSDYSLVKALQAAQQNFVVSDPSLPDNPIVFASRGFLTLTGYSLDEVLGRNCRFLQGPETDQKTIAKMRKAIEAGEDFTTVVLNYHSDGSTFWNQLFIAALRDCEGNVVNYLGVQCCVSEIYAVSFFQKELEDNDGCSGSFSHIKR